LEKTGQILKQQREELGFSIEDMSRKTKISALQLRELENGNVDFFHDDITYLPFMVKSYAHALYLNYDEFREDIENLVGNYHHTVKIKKIKENEAIERAVVEKTKPHSQSKGKIKVKKQSKKPEFSQLSLIFIILVIVSSLLFVFVTVVLPMINQGDSPNQEDPIINLPTNPNDDPDEPIDDPVDEEPIESIISVSPLSATEYAIVDFYEDEEVKISVNFNTQTWVRVYIDDVSTDNPQSRIYQPNESIDIITTAKDAHKVSFHVGVVRSNEFTVNDKVVTLDSSIANVTYGVRIHFIFVGE
jgi:cytoskeletal protein RodZ